MSSKISTILMGTPDFAAQIFKKAYPELKKRLNIASVVTAPDKPVGRKQVFLPCSVKKWALEANLSVLEPESIKEKESIAKIIKLNPELIILCAYGQIIPKSILETPQHGALNIHPSLLPKYRGPSPIQAAILNNDKETGITLMLMDQKMDHGPIISSSRISIDNMTYKQLESKLADQASKLLIKTLPKWIDKKIKAKPQDHSKATYCKIIKKQDGKIDWNKSAQEIENMIKAFEVWPNAYTFWNNKQLKILEAETKQGKIKKISEVFTENKELMVQTKKGILILKTIQLESKKPTAAKDFLNGHPEIIGANLE